MRAFLAAMMLALAVGFVGCSQQASEGGEEAAPAAEAPAEGGN